MGSQAAPEKQGPVESLMEAIFGAPLNVYSLTCSCGATCQTQDTAFAEQARTREAWIRGGGGGW